MPCCGNQPAWQEQHGPRDKGEKATYQGRWRDAFGATLKYGRYRAPGAFRNKRCPKGTALERKLSKPRNCLSPNRDELDRRTNMFTGDNLTCWAPNIFSSVSISVGAPPGRDHAQPMSRKDSHRPPHGSSGRLQPLPKAKPSSKGAHILNASASSRTRTKPEKPFAQAGLSL